MPVQVAMSGARKAAILLLTLGEDPSSEVCKHLHEDEVEVIAKELTTLGTVPAETGERVLDEFNTLASKAGYAGQGTVDYERRILERVRRVVRTRRVAQDHRDDDLCTRTHLELLTHGRAAGDIDVRVVRRRVHGERLDRGVRTRRDGVRRARDERQTIDDLSAGREDITGAHAIDDRLRPQLVGAVPDHRVAALVLARLEVLSRAAVVGTEAAHPGEPLSLTPHSR